MNSRIIIYDCVVIYLHEEFPLCYNINKEILLIPARIVTSTRTRKRGSIVWKHSFLPLPRRTLITIILGPSESSWVILLLLFLLSLRYITFNRQWMEFPLQHIKRTRLQEATLLSPHHRHIASLYPSMEIIFAGNHVLHRAFILYRLGGKYEMCFTSQVSSFIVFTSARRDNYRHVSNQDFSLGKPTHTFLHRSILANNDPSPSI